MKDDVTEELILPPGQALRLATRAEHQELERMLVEKRYGDAGVFLSWLCTRCNDQAWLGRYIPREGVV